MNSLTQYYIRSFRPKFLGWITRFIYSSKQVSFGNGLRCDSIPRILIDTEARLSFGNNVELRRSIEIRVHGTSNTRIGHGVRIDRGVRILSANKSKILIEEGARIGLYSVLNGGDSITIGKKSLVSGFVYLQTSMHGYADKNSSVQDQGYDHAPVILEEDVWLGTHVVILPGVVMGSGSVVGSNAVVNRSVEPHTVVGGIPAKKLKER